MAEWNLCDSVALIKGNFETKEKYMKKLAFIFGAAAVAAALSTFTTRLGGSEAAPTGKRSYWEPANRIAVLGLSISKGQS